METPTPAPIRLTVPAEADSLPLVRSLGTALVAGAPFPFDRVEDLRLLLTEMAGELLRGLPAGTEDAALSLRCWPGAGALTLAVSIDGRLPQPWPSPDVADGLSWQVIEALADAAEQGIVEGDAAVVIQLRHPDGDDGAG